VKLRRSIASTLMFAFLGMQLAPAVDLSPQTWNAADRKHVEEAETNPFPPRARAIEGSSAIISDTGSPIAVYAGMDALKKGGSAADAAASVALTQIATELGSYVSYAGILRLVYFEAKSGKVYSLEAGWNSYRGENDARSIPVSQLGLPGLSTKDKASSGSEGRKTLVPGFMAGIEAMHKRFGKLPFAQLFEPAIWYAENGVTVTPLLAKYFSSYGKFLARTPEGRQFMGQAGNDHPQVGTRFVQADLARTLRGVAKAGAGYMYTGRWGQQFVSAVQSNGGKVTMADMAAYQPVWEEPISTSFAEQRVFGPGPQSDNGQEVLEALNFAQEMELDRKQPYWKDPEVFSCLSRILQFVAVGAYPVPEVTAFEREHELSFSASDRVTKTYAKAMIPLVMGNLSFTPPPQDSHHSAGVVVVDRWGNVAALVHSINTMPWGTTGIVVGGIPLSDAAGFQQYRLAQVTPGDRVPDDMAPVIVMKANKPVMAVAAVGMSLVSETVRVLLEILGNHAAANTVLAAPPLLSNYEAPATGESYIWKRQIVPDGVYDSDFLQKLQSIGVKVQQEDRKEVVVLRGTAAFVIFDQTSRTLRTAEDPSVIDFGDAN
jgi:gamma-glutamyltranspeptidase / glutathione hydrolase